MAGAVGQVFAREQHLRHDDLEDLEQFAVNVHQAALPDGAHHLLGGQRAPQLREAEPFAPCRHRAGGHDNHLMPCLLRARGLLDDLQHPLPIQARSAIGQHAGANFEYDALSLHTPIRIGF